MKVYKKGKYFYWLIKEKDLQEYGNGDKSYIEWREVVGVYHPADHLVRVWVAKCIDTVGYHGYGETWSVCPKCGAVVQRQTGTPPICECEDFVEGRTALLLEVRPLLPEEAAALSIKG